jgi:uncharacterized protein (DUF2267 family)
VVSNLQAVRREVRKMVTRIDEVDVIEATVQKTYLWIRELDEELGRVGRRESYQVLRGFHALRDRLTVDEVAQLAAQLPVLVRGIYYEGWDPARKPPKWKEQEFLSRFAEQAAMDPAQEPVPALRAAARMLRRHVTPGETEDVLSILPKELRELLA